MKDQASGDSFPTHPLLHSIRAVHETIRTHVRDACAASDVTSLAEVAHDGVGDTIYAVDRISEAALVAMVSERIAAIEPVVLIAEGLPGGQMTLPEGTPEHQARWRIIVDPIDGTRGLMYQKRSAWILTGVAQNRGGRTGLRDIELAVQTELPLVKQHLADSVWAVRGQGVRAERVDLLSGDAYPLQLKPSRATSIAHGFATFARFFPGFRESLGTLDEEVMHNTLGPGTPGKAQSFEDQYISTGGQLYELMAGHDRFVADLRPLVGAAGLCCRPYDLCTELIARELGVVIASPHGTPLDAPLDTETDVAWVAYANQAIRDQLQPALQAALARRRWTQGRV